MHITSKLCINALLLLFPQLARAQSTGALEQGVRVRVVSQRGEERIGRVVSVTTDSIQVASDRSPGFVTTFSTGDIRRVDKSLGVSAAQGAVRGGLIGLLSGGIGGFAIMHLTHRHDSLAGVAGALWGGFGGATAGAFFGASNGIETWVELGKPFGPSSP